MDWNGDGINDVLVGEHKGHIKFYMGVTPDSLTEMDDLMAAGTYIDAGLIGCPLVMDWNDDGLLDLLVGFSSPPDGSSIQLYMNTGTSGNPVLEAGTDVLFGGEPLTAYGCTPWAGDMDQDGLTDLIFGDTPGNIYLCLNEGSAGAPVFSAPELLLAGSDTMNVSLNAAPCIFDWNNDGFMDIVAGCGEDGYMWVFLSPWTSGTGDSFADTPFSVTCLANPVHSMLSIGVSCSETSRYTLRVFSISGRTVMESVLNTAPGYGQFDISLPELQPGIYLYQVFSGMSQVADRFVVSENPR